MMRCNLAILLAERNLKITKVSNDTGISRTTLTSLYYNHAKGIQFDTYNTLCSYLKITPDRLMSYTPVDIEFIFFNVNTIDISVRTPVSKCINQLRLDTNINDDANKIHELHIWVGLFEATNKEEQENNEITLSAFKSLSPAFTSDLESEIISSILTDYDVPEDFTVQFYWEDGLN